MAADGFETKRSTVNRLPVRPDDPPPAASAPLDDREDWAEREVWWFLAETGGDPEIEGVPAGNRWRQEYFECVRDPQALQQYAEQEIQVFKAAKGAARG